jgi:hypothetical protein
MVDTKGQKQMTAKQIHESDIRTNGAIEEAIESTWRFHATAVYQECSYQFFHEIEDYEN